MIMIEMVFRFFSYLYKTCFNCNFFFMPAFPTTLIWRQVSLVSLPLVSIE